MIYQSTISVLIVYVICGTISFDLTILHTNDVHTRIGQIDKYGGACSSGDDIAGKCFGGVARRKAAVDDLKAKYPNAILIDGGDQYQGTIWFYEYKGKASVYFMNKIRYDVMALGNHEFDYGPDGVMNLLNNASFPILSCNLNAAAYPKIQAKVKKHVVLTIGGNKVGIIGYTVKDTPIISNPDE